MQQLQVANPQLYEMIQQNPGAAMQLLEGVDVGAHGPPAVPLVARPATGPAFPIARPAPVPAPTTGTTEEEKAAIERVTNFPKLCD